MDFKKFTKEHPIWADIVRGILFSLLLILVIMLFFRWFTRHGKEFDVPDMKGMTYEEVNVFGRDSNAQNFKFIINDSVFDPDVPGGVVLSQDPAPGVPVKKGRKIYLSVSMISPPRVEMPNLIDLSLRQAENMLTTNNLKLGQLVYKPSEFVNAVLEQRYKGRIIKQGARIPYNSEITLVVGKNYNAAETSEEALSDVAF